MNAILALIVCIALHIYDEVASFALFFVPRHLKKKKDITGKKVLITGAGNGLGRQMAVEFSKHSTYLILVDINRKSLLETEQLLDKRSTAFIYDCDVSDYKKVYEMAKKVRKEAGDVDILVNNAGIVSGQYLVDLPEEKIIRTMEVNALAHFWMCKAFLPAMMSKNEGHIVSIVSIAGKMAAVPQVTDYISSKFAAAGFAEAMEVELRAKKLDGIKVTVVYPSVIDTGLFRGTKIPFAELLTPEYVAEKVVSGVIEDKDSIFIQHYFRYMVMVQGLTSRKVIQKFSQLTGSFRSMENFTGRVQNRNKYTN